MSDQPFSPLVSTETTAPGTASPADGSVQRKRKEKTRFRGAWISFVSRIIAQFVGSAATIVLGLMYLQRYQPIQQPAAPAAQQESAAATDAAPVRAPSSAATLAVLAFDNFSGDPKQDHLANALTEAVIAEMSRKDGLRVTSRTSSTRYRGVGKPLPEIARELTVKWIVEGSIVSGNGRVRATAQLIDSSSDEHVWGAAYDRRPHDAVSLQVDLATAIAGDLARAIARGSLQHAEREGAASDGLRRDGVDEPAVGSANAASTHTRP